MCYIFLNYYKQTNYYGILNNDIIGQSMKSKKNWQISDLQIVKYVTLSKVFFIFDIHLLSFLSGLSKLHYVAYWGHIDMVARLIRL